MFNKLSQTQFIQTNSAIQHILQSTVLVGSPLRLRMPKV